MVQQTTSQIMRSKKDRIVANFDKRVRENISRARMLDQDTLMNHIPEFLDTIIYHLDKKQLTDEEVILEKKTSRDHGRDRSFINGYGVENLLAEYRQLRIAIFNCIEAEIEIPRNERDLILDMIQIGAKQAMLQFIYEKSSSPGILKYVPRLSWQRYLVSFILITVATGLQYLLKDYTANAPYIFFYPFILIAAIFGDGIVATLLTAFSVQYFFIEPAFSLTMQWPVDYTRNALFFIFAGLMVAVSKLLRRSMANASIAAEEQQLAKIELEETVRKLFAERILREQFVASLTHDLRGPLTSIRISAQHLMRNQKIETPERIYQRIINSAERADEMIQDLLDVSLIRSGQEIPITLESCNMNELIEDVIEELKLVYGDRILFHSRETVSGYWSYNGLKRVFENLITNAVKYGAQDAPIQISLSATHQMAKVEIQNRLVGQPLTFEEINNLFEPYQRLKSAKSSGKAGWGLGLTLVKGLVRSHGGSVEVISSVEEGTVFSVILPLDSRK